MTVVAHLIYRRGEHAERLSLNGKPFQKVDGKVV